MCGRKSSYQTSSIIMADVEQTISNSEKQSKANTEIPIKPLDTNDQSAGANNLVELSRSKTDLSVKSSGFDATKTASDQSNIPTDLQMSDSTSKKKGNQRRIIAEDPEWNLAAVESLSSLALRSIVKNFQGISDF